MSAFLGPIHIWLFEKIKFQENLNKHLIEMAAVKGYNKEKLAEVDSVCGVLEEGELADLIDGMNIHGWIDHSKGRLYPFGRSIGERNAL